MPEKESWNSVINKTDVDRKSLEFINIVAHYFNIAFPNKTVIISNVYNISSIWITKGIITSCKIKRKLCKLFVTNDKILDYDY